MKLKQIAKDFLDVKIFSNFHLNKDRDDLMMHFYPLIFMTEELRKKIEEILTRQRRLSRLLSPIGGYSFNIDEPVPEDQLCPICLTNKRDVILAPCGHKAMCKRCARVVLSRPEAERVCPFDRVLIESYITAIFDV